MSDNQKYMDWVYRERKERADRYSLDNAGNRFNFEQLRGRIIYRLKSLYGDIPTVKMLDLGSGELFWTREFIELGIERQNCIGSDILLWRLKKGRESGQSVESVVATAAQLPFPSESFDLITQMTMMTSVLDTGVRKEIALEMKRVLKPCGYILWYDFRFNNPGNPYTRAIGRREIEGLFYGWGLTCEKVTLLPQLARKLGVVLPGLLNFFSLFPILRTHYLILIGPKG
jgi:ubiquinone/menaquinone biosynthesis C-methylase UbiE